MRYLKTALLPVYDLGQDDELFFHIESYNKIDKWKTNRIHWLCANRSTFSEANSMDVVGPLRWQRETEALGWLSQKSFAMHISKPGS